MNQHDQMRQTVDRLLGEIVCLEWAIAAQDPWSELEVRVRDMKKIAEQALAAKPAPMKYYDEHGNDKFKGMLNEPTPLVRLTDDSLISIYLTCKAEWKATNKRERERIAVLFGHAVMDAMQERNK